MKLVSIAKFSELKDRIPAYGLLTNVDLVIIRFDEKVSVLYGRCPHRGALLSDGSIKGKDIVCGLHGWDYQFESGISSYNNEEHLQKFTARVENDQVLVDEDEIRAWEHENPQAYNREVYQGLYKDPHGAVEEPYVNYIQQLARNGLSKVGQHGPTVSMGVPRQDLPLWDDIQIVTAQLATFPRLDEENVSTEVIIGANAKKPLKLKIPIFVSDMSFGSLSQEAKIALAKGAEMAGTGICSGEGGMLPEEQAENSRYFYELASGRFGYALEKIKICQAFHFKGGQGAKTGTGGHLPGNKVKGKIAQVRGLKVGEPAVSPARFPDWDDAGYIKEFAQMIKEETGGIPVGYKLSAQHIEKDIDAALKIGCDYIILDGRGGGTGAAPAIFRDNISVPTIPALARARKHLDLCAVPVALVITGGLRIPADFAKALALGADAVAVSNVAIQAIGCLGMRACHTNNCPVGIATQKDHLRKRLIIDKSAKGLTTFLDASVQLMKVLARACGHNHLNQFNIHDLTTFKREMTDLTGIPFGGVR
jgi:methylamine---glutamate N-methyltransferase subunit C